MSAWLIIVLATAPILIVAIIAGIVFLVYSRNKKRKAFDKRFAELAQAAKDAHTASSQVESTLRAVIDQKDETLRQEVNTVIGNHVKNLSDKIDALNARMQIRPNLPAGPVTPKSPTQMAYESERDMNLGPAAGSGAYPYENDRMN